MSSTNVFFVDGHLKGMTRLITTYQSRYQVAIQKPWDNSKEETLVINKDGFQEWFDEKKVVQAPFRERYRILNYFYHEDQIIRVGMLEQKNYNLTLSRYEIHELLNQLFPELKQDDEDESESLWDYVRNNNTAVISNERDPEEHRRRLEEMSQEVNDSMSVPEVLTEERLRAIIEDIYSKEQFNRLRNNYENQSEEVNPTEESSSELD